MNALLEALKNLNGKEIAVVSTGAVAALGMSYILGRSNGKQSVYKNLSKTEHSDKLEADKKENK